VYFRVSRQDAERLAKESANIVQQLEQREDNLLQEPGSKFTMQEMWEIAFHSLARLEARKAYVMVKCAMEHPELIRTLDNPAALPRPFKFSETYRTLASLTALAQERSAIIAEAVKAFLHWQEEQRKQQKQQDSDDEIESPDLDFPPDE
jgi:hypothetical protein